MSSPAPRAPSPGALTTAVRRLFRLRWLILAAWLIGLALAGVGAAGLDAQLSGGGWYAPGSQSSAAVAATKEGFVGRGQSTLVLVTSDSRHTASDGEFAERATEAYRHVAALPGLKVSSANGWATTEGRLQHGFLGDGGRTTVTTLGLDLPDGDARRELPQIQAGLEERFTEDGLTVSLVGPTSLWGEINVMSEHGLLRAELLALPLLIGIMLWIYRGWVAAGLSLLVAVTSIVWTLGVLSLIAPHLELSVFVKNAATMLGLGVAVDYSLFIISRYREQVQRGEPTEQALTSALRTAGHTVLSSGLTVVFAMSTLFLIDLPVIRSLALGAVTVVSVAMAVNLLVLPMLLTLVGGRVARPGVAAATAPVTGNRWERWAAAVMRRPVASLLAGLAVLAALALPAAQLSTFTPDARIVPPDASVRIGWDAVRNDFGPGAASPVNVVVSLDTELSSSPVARQALRLSSQLDELEGSERVVSADTILRDAGVSDPLSALHPDRRASLPTQLEAAVGHYLSADARTLVIEVIPDDTASSERSRELLRQVRELTGLVAGPGIGIVVGGETAEGVDGNAAIADGLPFVGITMLVTIYLLLMLIFRSLLLPLKAIAMNVASVAATYGVLVLVFQKGWGEDLLGFESTGQVTNFVPVLLLTLLFSLSTDYEVFLLSRVREEWTAGADDARAVPRGLALTAPLISGAAVLMVAVFAAFAFASVLPVQELGLGMAVAIVLDATLVRLVLVPASMRLMGHWNWWHPLWQPRLGGARRLRRV